MSAILHYYLSVTSGVCEREVLVVGWLPMNILLDLVATPSSDNNTELGMSAWRKRPICEMNGEKNP